MADSFRERQPLLRTIRNAARQPGSSQQPLLPSRMPFGKYKGTLLSAVPDDYLTWVATWHDLRDPLRTAILREGERRGTIPAFQSLAARVQDVQTQGFFIVPAGRETEVGTYHAWCAATGTPSICVSVGGRSAMIALVFFGPSLPASSMSRLMQTLEARWRDYEPQHMVPHSFVLLNVPGAVVTFGASD